MMMMMMTTATTTIRYLQIERNNTKNFTGIRRDCHEGLYFQITAYQVTLKVLRAFETSVNINKTTTCNIPDDLNVKLHFFVGLDINLHKLDMTLQ
jgi:hypothetical protein